MPDRNTAKRLESFYYFLLKNKTEEIDIQSDVAVTLEQLKLPGLEE